VTDARFVRAPDQRPRRGLGGWIALWVAGEPRPLSSLQPAPSAEERAELVALGLCDDDGTTLGPRVRVLPWRGLVVAAPPAESFDVSALNVAASLPPVRTLLDVGCGAGLLALAAARAGAAVVASDIDAELVGWAERNRAINQLRFETAVGDLLEAAPPGRRFEAIVFNAPLLRAPLAAADDAPRYTTSPRGEALALAVLAGAAERLEPNGRLLLHAQLTPAVSAALEGWAASAAVRCIVFAHAPDGTPHALSEIDRAGPPGHRRVYVPLSPACPHLGREILDAQAAPRALDDDATPVPAPWLELRTSERYDGGRRRLATRFGGVGIEPEEVMLLDRLDGRPLGALALSLAARESLSVMIERGHVILR
jgi:methylase of polypeptide subunit release factors